ncbi:MAG: porin [Gemmatimonadales bacterium]
MRHEHVRPSLAVAIPSLATLLLAVAATPAFAQVQISTKAVELEFSGRLQYQAETSSCTDATPAASSACSGEAPGVDMFLRRARVSLEATIDDRLSFKLEPDFSDVKEVSLKDAWGRYAFGPGVAVQAGHFKRPFDGFQLTSSSWLPFERAVEIPGVSSRMLPSYSGLAKAGDMADRDIGVMLEGEQADGRFAWWLGVFRGGTDATENDTNTGKQFVGRVQVTVDAGDRSLKLAGAYARTDVPYTGVGGETVAEYSNNFELFAERGSYGQDGLLLQAGVILGDNPLTNQAGAAIDLAAGEEFASLLTWQGVAAYRVPVDADWLEAIAPMLRVSYADPTDLENDQVWGFTPGFTIYFYRRNRLTLNWDVASFGADGIDSANSFKAQMQFHF